MRCSSATNTLLQTQSDDLRNFLPDLNFKSFGGVGKKFFVTCKFLFMDHQLGSKSLEIKRVTHKF